MTSAQLDAAVSAPEVTHAREAMRDPKRDVEAVALFTKAANQGNAVADTYLGYLSYMGHGVEQNDRAAAEWYRRGADLGFADAQFRLGVLYLYGRDLKDPARSVAQDVKQGMAWIERAAEAGNPKALDMIADESRAPYSLRMMRVLMGRISGQDAEPTPEETAGLHKAVDLYSRAAAQDDGYAATTLCSLRGFLVPVPADMLKWCARAEKPDGSWLATSTSISVHGIDVDPAILSSDEIPMRQTGKPSP